jgi:hypothetical protein
LALDPCPDESLRSQVVDVRYDRSGAPTWVLRDGRVLQRNPVVGKNQPLLVEVVVADDAGKPAGEKAADGVLPAPK